MIASAFRSYFDRVKILFNREISSQQSLEVAHATLISSGFYVTFRSKLDAIYKIMKDEIDCAADKSLYEGLSTRQITLGYFQKLSLRTINSNSFKRNIAYATFSKRKIWFPLSKSSREQLQELGLSFNGPMCGMLLFCFNLVSTYVSVKKYIRTRHQIRRSKVVNAVELFDLEKGKQNFIYLHLFSASNFPSRFASELTLFSWIEKCEEFNSHYLHDCKDIRLDSSHIPGLTYMPFPLVLGKRITTLRADFLMLKKLIGLGFSFRVKNWHWLCQIDEIFFASLLNVSEKDIRLNKVFIPSTVLIAKPLWANILENSGTEVILLNYTAMAEPLDPQSNMVVDGIWRLSNWRMSWVVDEIQGLQMQRTSHNSLSNYRVIGVPWWSGKVFEHPQHLRPPFISVFDTHIRSNEVFSAGTLDDFGWNNPILESTFIISVLEVAAKLGFTVLHKRKRKVSDSKSLELRKLVDELGLIYGKNYYNVDEIYAAESIIKASIAVISKPISTTSIIANQLGVPSIVFDITGRVNPDDPGLRNCELAYDKNQLYEALNRTLNK